MRPKVTVSISAGDLLFDEFGSTSFYVIAVHSKYIIRGRWWREEKKDWRPIRDLPKEHIWRFQPVNEWKGLYPTLPTD